MLFRSTHLALAELGDDGDLLVEVLLHVAERLALLGQDLLGLLDGRADLGRLGGVDFDLGDELLELGLDDLDAALGRFDRLGVLDGVLLRLALADLGLEQTLGRVFDARLEVRDLGLLAPELDASDLEDLLLEDLDFTVDRVRLLL